MPPTVEQFKALTHDVAQLNDPEVRVAVRDVFGSPSDPGPPLPEPVGIEVDIVDVADGLVYRVVRWIPSAASSQPGVTVDPGCRWINAAPPWGCKASLLSLVDAVAFLRELPPAAS